jgi:putative flippase GtrA
VNLTPSALLAHSRTEGGKRAIRYSATSAICVLITQVFILVFYRGFHFTEARSNLAATMLTSIPAFALNKYWVWGKRGRAHVRRELLPFWAFTVSGWILSTGAVKLVAENVGDPRSTLRTLSVMVASIAGFGVLWILKYLFLDKIMFGPHHHTPYDEDIEVEEAALEAGAAVGKTG